MKKGLKEELWKMMEGKEVWHLMVGRKKSGRSFIVFLPSILSSIIFKTSSFPPSNAKLLFLPSFSRVLPSIHPSFIFQTFFLPSTLPSIIFQTSSFHLSFLPSSSRLLPSFHPSFHHLLDFFLPSSLEDDGRKE